MRRSNLVAIAAALGAATCCPTLFLVVEKGKPAPRPWLPEAEIVKEDPIPQPERLENRFLADQGKDADRYPDYNDADDMSLEESGRAWSALEQIKRDYHLRSTATRESQYTWLRGKLECEHEGGMCYAFHLTGDTKDVDAKRIYPSIEISQTLSARHTRIDEIDCTDAGLPPAEPKQEACTRAWLMAQQCSKLTYHPDAATKVPQADLPDSICTDVAVILQSCMRLGFKTNAPEPAIAKASVGTAVSNSRDSARLSLDKPAVGATGNPSASNADKSQTDGGADEPPLCGSDADLATRSPPSVARDRVSVKAAFTQDRSPGTDSEKPYRRIPCVCEPIRANQSIPLKAGIPGKPDEDVSVKLHTYYKSSALSTPLFTFIHITDAQVRDPTVLVGGRSMSHKLDWLVQSFEYSVDLESNDRALAEAMIATINKEVEVYRRRQDDAQRELLAARHEAQGAGGPSDQPDTKPSETKQPVDQTNVRTARASGNNEPAVAELAKTAARPEADPDANASASKDDKAKGGKANRAKDGKANNEAIAKTKLQSARGAQPQFVIHTGDAIDAGVTSELRDFHRLLDRLDIPSFNAIGSHDVMVFGNLMPTRHRHSDKECATVESVMSAKVPLVRDCPWLAKPILPNRLCIYADIKCDDCGSKDIRFVAAGKKGEPINHTNARKSFIGGFEHRNYDDVPQPTPIPHNQLVDGDGPAVPAASKSEAQPDSSRCEAIAPLRPSRQHGFDLNREAPDSGYYAFSSPITVHGEPHASRKVVSIVLNTEDFSDDGRPMAAGVLGRVGKLQLEWLRDTLKCTDERDLVLVFGHVALSEIEPADVGQDRGELMRVLNAQKNLVAYFYGHGHEHEICGDRKRADVCSRFWEVATASLLEYPQEAHRVRIKDAGDGLAFIELVAFRERLAKPSDERAKAIELARKEGEIDRCYSIPDKICENGHMQRTDGLEANARLWFVLPGN